MAPARSPTSSTDPRLRGVDPTDRRDVWVKKLLYPAHTVPMAAAPVVVGVGVALGTGVFSPLPAVAVFLFGWLVQLGGVLADNYFNLVRYRDDAEHPALVYALDHDVIALETIRRAVVATFLLAATLGLALVWIGGAPVVVVGLASVAVSVLYSAEITDVPLHDLYFFVFFGPVSVGGTYYLQAVASVPGVPLGLEPGTLPAVAILAGVPVGALTTAILVVDNVRDLEFDREKEDRTLAVVIGETASRLEYHALVAVAYLSPVGIWLGYGVDPPYCSRCSPVRSPSSSLANFGPRGRTRHCIRSRPGPDRSSSRSPGCSPSASPSPSEVLSVGSLYRGTCS
ncbi:MAG: prenyltransferase [Halanaeroarchaeum sp.]